MTTIANNVVAKLAVAFVAVAMMFWMVAPANAQNVEDMSLEELIALVAQLQNQMGGSVSSSAVCPYTWTRDLSKGATGADVMTLQKFLNSMPETQVAASGAGAPGMETSYYGSLSAAAVSNFQMKYRAEILTPLGLVNPTGYFGAGSRAKANDLCHTDAGNGGNGDDNNDNGGSDNGALEGGAGDITVDQTGSDVDDEVLEGDDDVKVLGFDVEANDSDIEISSIEVEFKMTGSGNSRLNRYADEVTIWMDGDMVGSADVSDFDEDNDVYSNRIALDDAIIREDDEARFYVAVTANNTIDSEDLSENWKVGLGDTRFRDGSGAVLTESKDGISGNVTETFTFEDLASAGDVELTITEGDEEVNDAHTAPISDTSNTNDVEILSFVLEADGSDITVNSLTFLASSTGADFDEMFGDWSLLMDGEEVGDFDYGDDGSATTSTTLVFTNLDDDDVMIDEGDEVEFTLVADVNDTEGNFGNGDSVSVQLIGDDNYVDAEDENGDDLDTDTLDQIKGTADSEDISFSASGIMADLNSSTAEVDNNVSDVSTDDEGVYTMEFDVTAFDKTAYVELEAASSTNAAGDNVGVAYVIENASTGATVGTGTRDAILERVSGGSLSGNFVRINPGQTATFRLTVNFDPTAKAYYRVQMKEIGFTQTTSGQADQAHATVPVEQWESNSVQVQN